MAILAHIKELVLHLAVLLFEKLFEFLIKEFGLNSDDFNPDDDPCFDDCDI